MAELVRPISAVAWELRAMWARGWRVSLTVSGDETRVEGIVAAVSPTGAYAVISGLHVPLRDVLAVHRPSRLGDSTHDERGPWSGTIPSVLRRDPRQLTIPGL